MNIQAHLASTQCPLSNPTLSGKIQRFNWHGSTDGWFRGEETAQGSFAVYGSWVTGERHEWMGGPDGTELESQASKELKKVLRKKQKALEAEERAFQEERATAADSYFRSCERTGPSAYLASKGIPEQAGRAELFGCRIDLDGHWREAWGLEGKVSPDFAKKHPQLIVPGRDFGGKVWTVQRIGETDGKKKFMLPGGRVSESFHLLSPDSSTSLNDFLSRRHSNSKAPVILCEGVATGITLLQATGLPVLSCFSATNLKAVGKKLRAIYPALRVLICGDNDAFTLIRGVPVNPGRLAAQDLAESIGLCKVFLPHFPLGIEGTPTDWNDLHQIVGLNGVKAQLGILEEENGRKGKRKFKAGVRDLQAGGQPAGEKPGAGSNDSTSADSTRNAEAGERREGHGNLGAEEKTGSREGTGYVQETSDRHSGRPACRAPEEGQDPRKSGVGNAGGERPALSDHPSTDSGEGPACGRPGAGAGEDDGAPPELPGTPVDDGPEHNFRSERNARTDGPDPTGNPAEAGGATNIPGSDGSLQSSPGAPVGGGGSRVEPGRNGASLRDETRKILIESNEGPLVPGEDRPEGPLEVIAHPGKKDGRSQRIVDSIRAHYGDSLAKQGDDIFHWRESRGHWLHLQEAHLDRLKRQINEVAMGKLEPHHIDAALKMLRLYLPTTSRNVFIPPAHLTNFENGTLELNTAKGVASFRAHCKEDYLLNKIPLQWQPDDAHRNAEFEAMLDRVFGPSEEGQEKRKALSQVYGGALVPAFPRLVLILGRPGTGKSSIITPLEIILGSENLSHVDPTRFRQDYGLSLMVGKLLNVVKDINVQGVLCTADLKTVEDKDTITVRRIFRDPISAKIPALHVYGANEMPRSLETNHAFQRRWTIIECDQFQPSGHYDKEFSRHLVERDPQGVLNFAIAGLQELLKRNGHYLNPESGQRRLAEWAKAEDPVAQFIEALEEGEVELPEKYTRGESSMPRTALFNLFNEWRETGGMRRHEISRLRFFTRVRDLGFQEKKVNGARHFTGLGLAKGAKF